MICLNGKVATTTITIFVSIVLLNLKCDKIAAVSNKKMHRTLLYSIRNVMWFPHLFRGGIIKDFHFFIVIRKKNTHTHKMCWDWLVCAMTAITDFKPFCYGDWMLNAAAADVAFFLLSRIKIVSDGHLLGLKTKNSTT